MPQLATQGAAADASIITDCTYVRSTVQEINRQGKAVDRQTDRKAVAVKSTGQRQTVTIWGRGCLHTVHTNTHTHTKQLTTDWDCTGDVLTQDLVDIHHVQVNPSQLQAGNTHTHSILRAYPTQLVNGVRQVYRALAHIWSTQDGLLSREITLGQDRGTWLLLGRSSFGENDINGYLMSVHWALISELIEGWNNRRGLCDSGGLVGVISEWGHTWRTNGWPTATQALTLVLRMWPNCFMVSRSCNTVRSYTNINGMCVKCTYYYARFTHQFLS